MEEIRMMRPDAWSSPFSSWRTTSRPQSSIKKKIVGRGCSPKKRRKRSWEMSTHEGSCPQRLIFHLFCFLLENKREEKTRLGQDPGWTTLSTSLSPVLPLFSIEDEKRGENSVRGKSASDNVGSLRCLIFSFKRQRKWHLSPEPTFLMQLFLGGRALNEVNEEEIETREVETGG